MLLIPAIDLKDGHCVRLKQGDMDQSTTFGEDPAAMARKWVDAGARRLHLVDLNGAFAGVPKNYGAIKSILKEVGDDIPVQLGGGIRDLDTIEKYIDGGLRYVIIGTAAVKNPGFLKDACSAFGGHIIVGLDAKDGKVATDGWSKLTGHEVVDLAKKFEDWGVESIIYTDIGRDGMLSGINIDATVKLAQALSIPVIASGGLSNMTDIEQLCAVESEGVEGVICGRAIYSGDLDFEAGPGGFPIMLSSQDIPTDPLVTDDSFAILYTDAGYTFVNFLIEPDAPTPAELAEDGRALVQDLVDDGRLRRGLGAALDSKLASVLVAIDAGDTATACGSLRAFNNQVNAVVTGAFLVLVATVVITCARVWWQLLSGKRASDLHEEPYVAVTTS